MEPELRRISAAEEEDIRLMGQARAGDVDAFSLLVGRHRERVESFLFRLFGDREMAEDGAQEVFLRLWLARGRYQAHARFTTLLFQVAHNYWRDAMRKAGARPVEVLSINDARAQMTADRAPEAALRARAPELDLLWSFTADARAKIADGLTTVEEVDRVFY